ncbi:MAG: OpgC domain-containing protein [Rhodopseudomonas sp.]|uniref:OpgC domain-containing protein n=1 Tax=Rhodopseudomonas sp. TaxID=1078 RepID=UPI0017B11756|nr:OpgC domain-containing protein [Rhodopseudomonas sp.]NVN87259.1 OpgC domain-containing protein [Rhodopseudomonas sp.]
MSLAIDQTAPPLKSAAEAGARDPASATDPHSRTLAPQVAVRELRLDLFRGLALWLIFIDHVSPDVLTWFTIRSYGFSDAAEIFIFVSGYTAAFVYGRAMVKSGIVIATARIMRRVWQIYAAHVLLFAVLITEVSYVAVILGKPFYAQEVVIGPFLDQPGPAMVQALLLRYRPLNMDVLPLYIVLMAFLPLILKLIAWRANLTLAASVLLYALSRQYHLNLTAYPGGVWTFNPFAWQLLFVFGAWCALGDPGKWMSRLIASPITLWVALAYLFASFGLTMTWYFPQLEGVVPDGLGRWIYPIGKTDLDLLRFLHFLALGVVAVRLVPAGWPGLTSPWLAPMILCGQRSLEIFCLGVALAFVGYFVLTETGAGLALHALVGVVGIAILSAVAWSMSWFKFRIDKNGAGR